MRDHVRMSMWDLGLCHRPYPGQGGFCQESWKGEVEAGRQGPAPGDRMTSPRGGRGAGPLLPPPGRGRPAPASAFPPRQLGRDRREEGRRRAAGRRVGEAVCPGLREASFSAHRFPKGQRRLTRNTLGNQEAPTRASGESSLKETSRSAPLVPWAESAPVRTSRQPFQIHRPYATSTPKLLSPNPGNRPREVN